MSRGEANGAPAVTLEQLIALNDEIASLVRAGVPLEEGLVELGRDMPGRLGEAAAFLGQRLSRGETLSQILAREDQQFPPVWRAVVEAGVRSGRLSSALESLSTTARRVAELRRAVGVAWIYPLVVLTLAFCLFTAYVTYLAPVILRVFESFQISGWILEPLVWLGQTSAVWAIAVPVLVAVGFGLWWHISGRAIWLARSARTAGENGAGGLRWPTAARSLRDGRLAAFAELLALLVDHRVPLPEALALAGDASGDRGLGEASRSVAQRLEQGEVFTTRQDVPAQFPPFLGWLVATARNQPGLSESLRQLAETYRVRAAGAATWNAVYLPIVLTVIFGGSAVLLYGLIVFFPVARLLYVLS